MNDSIRICEATVDDVPAMLALIFEHGVNPWNFLPQPEVRAHLGAISGGATQAVLALAGDELIGFVSFIRSRSMARYRVASVAHHPHGYVCEAVVHRGHTGKGLGTRLLLAASARLASQEYKDIYIERHEQNSASAGMMRKAGFVEIDTFDDPARRQSGSRRTTVCRLVLP